MNYLVDIVSEYSTELVLVDWVDPDLLNWSNLSQNPSAIDLLEANQDKIDWHSLSLNPNGIHLLEANPDKIYWNGLSHNESIFVKSQKRSTFHLLSDALDVDFV